MSASGHPSVVVLEPRGPLTHEDRKLGCVDDSKAEFLGLCELRTSARPRRDEVGLLRHARRRLAPGRDDRLLCTLAGEALERTGGHDRQASKRTARSCRGPGPGMSRRRELYAGGSPACNDLAVPVDLEPVDERVRDDATHAVDRCELLARRGANRVERAEVVGEGSRGHGPDVTDVEAHQDAPEGLRLRRFEVLDEFDRALGRNCVLVPKELAGLGVVWRVALLALALERRDNLGFTIVAELDHPGLAVAHLHPDGKEIAHRELEEARLRLERWLGGKERLSEGRGADLAQALDVERAAAADVLDTTAHLRWAGARVGAPEVDIALLCRSQG